MILAGDIGGTKSRLALFEEKEGKQFSDEQKFASRDFPDFASLLAAFMKQEKNKRITAASFGVAGPVKEGVCQATNLPWVISAKELEKTLNIPKVYLINDLEANAWGLRCLNDEEFFTVNAGLEQKGNQALISAGTGLGEAGLIWNGVTHHPFACEGGHCDFAPTNQEEIELLQYFMRLYDHVSYERVLSGAGLFHLYRFLIESGREKEDPAIAELLKQAEPQRVITEKGTSRSCKACVRACRLFVELYGAETGNTALKFLAVGGVFLGGGIAPHLLSFFQESAFMQAFADKGRFAALLKEIPIKIVLNEKTALIGAARYAQEK
jgi:glucokinase